MSDDDKTRGGIDLFEEAIKKEYIKYYNFGQFNNVKEIGSGGFSKVYRAILNRKVLALKAFEYRNTDTKEIIREINLLRKVDYHENIIRFLGVTEACNEYGNSLSQSKKYMIVMEYADGGSLRNYLKNSFKDLTWKDKFKLAYQIATALECIHNEGIVHRDLNSNNVLVNQHKIKLADFGLSRIIEEKSGSRSAKLFGVLPYIDPNSFEYKDDNENLSQSYKLNEKSDTYSLGVLFWEISSGKRPFDNWNYNLCLAMKIAYGLREEKIDGTPSGFVELYTECWDGDPNRRNTIQQIVVKLKDIMRHENVIIDDDQNYDHEAMDKSSEISNNNTSVSSSLPSQGISKLDIMKLEITQSKDEEKSKTERKVVKKTSPNFNDKRRSIDQCYVSFAQFVPLIKEVAKIYEKINDLYSAAQHNKKIVNLLMRRVAAVNSAVSILREDSLYTTNHYAGLQRLINVIQEIKKYSEVITQYSTVQKYLETKTIETKFNKLCEEYNSSVDSLKLDLIVDFKKRVEKESLILQEEIKDLLQFQSALAESMDGKMEIVSTLIQEQTDNIFHEPLLPFEEYSAGVPRDERLRKYVHVKTQQSFAFKTIFKDRINQAMNQVAILKKVKECQNIIRFYGLSFDGVKYYLVTEWAENKNLREYIALHGQNIEIMLRIRFAYDIAKGLNFLNAVKIVHRDIRAENIVITEYDVAKITNFKSSRGYDAPSGDLDIDEERVKYSAPEILRRMMTDKWERNKKYDIKCEIYSFGIILWEIAECRVSYENFKDISEIIDNVVVNGYRESFTPGTNIPSKYQTLVSQAVDQHPGARPTFARMLTELNGLINDPSIPRIIGGR